MKYSKIIGTGSYVPQRVVPNEEIVTFLQRSGSQTTTSEWIEERSGILTRRIAEKDETNATMGAKALEFALKDAGKSVENLDLIIVGTNTNRYRWPACAAEIHGYFGAPLTCGAFDIQAGCTGFSYALSTADAYMRSDVARNVSRDQKRLIAVIGTDKLSEFVDWKDRTTCILFGDMAAAFILEESDHPGLIKHVLGADGSQIKVIGISDYDIARLIEREQQEQSLPFFTTGTGYLTMNGREVFRFVGNLLPQLILEVLERTGYALQDLKGIFPHNANCRMTQKAIEKLAEQTKIPLSELQAKFYELTSQLGNTSTASYPHAFDVARKKGIVKKGDLCMIVSFGAGLTWGGTLLRL